MTITIGIITIILGLIGWVGQTLAVFNNVLATKLGLSETEEVMDPTMLAFERFSMGIMDFLLMWILPVSAFLMIIQNAWWPVFALVGGAVYLYIPGCFTITRIVLGKRGLKIGTRSAQVTAYVLAVLWTVDALVMMYLAVKGLSL